MMNAADLEFIEREAGKNIDFHINNLECLNKEAHTTLSILFIWVPASFAVGMKFLEQNLFSLCYVLFGLSAYLSILAALLVQRCLKAEALMPPTNEPANFTNYLGQHSLEKIREGELQNLQERIDFNRARAATAGDRLNAIRLQMCIAPFLVVVIILCVLAFRS